MRKSDLIPLIPKQPSPFFQKLGRSNKQLEYQFLYSCALRALSSEKGFDDKLVLVVRRDRNIGNKTGTMLSEDDRKLGSAITDKSVITLYRNVGDPDKGWDGAPFWMPNLKLPKGKVFEYRKGL